MKTVTSTLLLSGLAGILFAQQPALTNGNMETWTQFTGTNESYWEPGTGATRTTHFLRTLNQLADEAFPLTGPVTTIRETNASDVYAGTYAAKMVSNVLSTFFLPGFVGTGDLDIVGQTIHLGRQFDGRPEKFQGWYKYTPVSGDSAEFRVWLTRYDDMSMQSVLVGEGSQKILGAVNTYTMFDIAINYLDPGTPDTVVIFCTASAGYNLTNLLSSTGQAGSALWADDMSFYYPAGINEDELTHQQVKVYPTLVSDILSVQTTLTNPNMKVRVYDINGKVIINENMPSSLHTIDVSMLAAGTYVVVVQDAFHLLARHRFIKQ